MLIIINNLHKVLYKNKTKNALHMHTHTHTHTLGTRARTHTYTHSDCTEQKLRTNISFDENTDNPCSSFSAIAWSRVTHSFNFICWFCQVQLQVVYNVGQTLKTFSINVFRLCQLPWTKIIIKPSKYKNEKYALTKISESLISSVRFE